MKVVLKELKWIALTLLLVAPLKAKAEGFIGTPVTSVRVGVRVNVANPMYGYNSCSMGYCGGGYGGGFNYGSHGFGGGYGYGYGYGYGGGYGYGYGYGYPRRISYCGGGWHSSQTCGRYARWCGYYGHRWCGKRRHRSFSLNIGFGGFAFGLNIRSF